MENSSFPIGFWNYPNIGTTPVSDVKTWKDAGITFNQTPSFSYAQNKKEQMIAFLDEMNACGIKAIVFVYDLVYNNFIGNPDGFIDMYKRAYEDFGHHPATAGFFLGDEPTNKLAMDVCIKCIKTVRVETPEMIPFLNFLPYWRGFESDLLGNRDFDEWIDEFIKLSGCPMICYDCYTQMNPGKEGWDMYFLNLHKYMAAAKRNNIQLWSTLLSVGHFRYRVPSEDDLRWQISTAVASGCSGLLWFYWYGQSNFNNYRGAPIDELGEKSPTYDSLRRVQKIFHNRYGEMMTKLTHVNTFHYTETFGDYTGYTTYAIPHVLKAESVHGQPGIISHFKDAEGRDYIVIVNNTPWEACQHKIVVDPGVKHIWRYWNGNTPTDFLCDNHDAYLEVRENYVAAGSFMAPGQMELIRIEY